jgi:hypothetical protein
MIDDGIFWDALLMFVSESKLYIYIYIGIRVNLNFEFYVLILRGVDKLLTCRYNTCILAKILFLYFCFVVFYTQTISFRWNEL